MKGGPQAAAVTSVPMHSILSQALEKEQFVKSHFAR